MLTKTLSALILVVVVLVSACVTQPVQESSMEENELDDFAKCIKESGLKVYGSFTCSVCKQQRALFGSAWDYVGEIECHPRGENPQTELCLQRDIKKTPTWMLEKDGEEVERHEGYQKLETLAELSGCSLEKV